MRRNKIVFIAIIALTSIILSAQVKSKMDEMLGLLMALKPYLVSQQEFINPKNEPQIKDALRKMTALSQRIKHDDEIEKSSRESMALSLHQQFNQAAENFERGHKIHAHWMLKSNLGNCISCHTQLPSHSTDFKNLSGGALASDFQEAEFLYIIRSFDQAMLLYDKALANYPGNKVSTANLDLATKRKIYFFTRVKRDLLGLQRSLEKNLENKKLPKSVLQNLQDYAKAAAQLSKEPKPSFKQAHELEAFAEKILKDELAGNFSYDNKKENLQRLQLSGYLYEYLEKNETTDLKAKIYYWLSFCESRWEQGLQESLPEIYLKKCINEFPKSKVAPKCLEQYKDLMIQGYSGSSGTHLPGEVLKELAEMEKKILKSE